jgi:hypothetical protein
VIDEFAKDYLHGDLRWIRQALLWKLDGLSEYEIRRPLTSTGTNLLGLVKHLATWEARYLGEVFNRPFPDPLADILREQLDGAVGTDPQSAAAQSYDAAYWENRRAKIEQAARAADPAQA